MEINFILVLAIVVFFASIVHGSIGFGFGMIATPLIALYSNLQIAIIFLLLPTMIVNIISILSEGKFFEALRKFWFIIVLMIIGSSIGTILLLFSNSEVYKLLLALIILVYLLQSYIKIEASFISKYAKASTYGLGLIGGVFSGLTNVVAPLMIMYTLELKYTRKDTVQLSNLCFLFTKIGQMIVLIYFGTFTTNTLELSMISIMVVLFGMYLGIKIKKRIDAKFYTKILQVLLFIIACILILQVVL